MSDLQINASINVAQVKKGEKAVTSSIDKIDRKTRDFQNEVNARSKRARAAFRMAGQRRSGRGGMAVLEASRAIEDYSVAGMRGALNNIPGIIQSIAPSMMAITGATTIALVAVWKLGEAYEKVLDKRRMLLEGRLGKGFSLINFDNTVAEAEKAAEKIETRFGEIKTRIDRGGDVQGTRTDVEERIAVQNREVALAEKLALMKRDGASETEMENARLESRYQGILRERRAQEERLKTQRTSLQTVEIEADRSQKLVDRAREARKELENMDRIRRQRMLSGVSEARRNPDGTFVDPAAATASGQRAVERFEEETRARRELLADYITEGKVQENRLALLKQEIEEREHALKLAEDTDRAEKNQLATRARLLAVAKTELEWAEEAQRRQSILQFGKSLGIGGGTVSALGRSGLGAAEATNAGNLQKSMLSVLKSIDKTLKTRFIEAYAT